MNYLIVFLGLLGYVIAQTPEPCTGPETGNKKDLSCAAWKECDGEFWVSRECTNFPENAMNFVTEECVTRTQATPPCNTVEDCAGEADGNYPYLTTGEGCFWFYTCQQQEFKGHQPCNLYCQTCENNCEAPCLVFDSRLGNCNWPADVPTPCGDCVDEVLCPL